MNCFFLGVILVHKIKQVLDSKYVRSFYYNYNTIRLSKRDATYSFRWGKNADTCTNVNGVLDIICCWN